LAEQALGERQPTSRDGERSPERLKGAELKAGVQRPSGSEGKFFA